MEDPELETTIFAAEVRAIEPDERVLEEVKASLNDLKTLLPADIDPEANPDLLFCAGNIAVAGIVNRNDDGMDKITALAVYSKFKNKFIDFEHRRKQVVGFVLHAGLSEIGTNRIITEEEARESDQPFNIALVFVVWKAVNPDLADDIVASSNPAHSDFNSLSLSFEMAFKGFYIAVLPDDQIAIASATKLVTPDAPDFAKWKKTLRAYKGTGASLEGEGRTYRILPITTIPLGGGIVENPAAPVKGLTVITEAAEPPANKVQEPVESKEPIDVNKVAVPMPVQARLDNDDDDTGEIGAPNDDAFRAAAQVRFNNFYQIAANVLRIGVSPVTTITNPSIMNLKEYQDKVNKAEKLEDFKEVAMASLTVIEAISQESERREQAKKDAETQASEVARLKSEIEAARDQAVKDLAAVKTELDQIKATQHSESMARKFDERMNLLSETFEFSDDERAEVVADIKDLSDEAFAKFMDKSKKLMKEKTKDFIKQKKDEAKASREQLVASLKEKGVNVKLGETFNVEEVIASALANPTSEPAGSVLEAAKTLKDRAQAAFANVTMGGKKFSELEETK